jgi:hypothetical protein
MSRIAALFSPYLREIDVGVGEVGAHEGEATDLVRGVLEAG